MGMVLGKAMCLEGVTKETEKEKEKEMVREMVWKRRGRKGSDSSCTVSGKPTKRSKKGLYLHFNL